jgi:hypothetical protein
MIAKSDQRPTGTTPAGSDTAIALRDKEHYARLPTHYLFGAIPVGGDD